MSKDPRVSIVISAYRAAGTIRACLDSLAAQSYRNFELQLVDGGPDRAVERIAPDYEFIRYTRIDDFCTMHRKRNVGVSKAAGQLLVFSDPDVVAHTDWLEELVACWDRHHRPVAGAIACLGRRLTDRIVHLIKFDGWLPPGRERPVEAGATANLLVSLQQFRQIGGFDESTYLGDLKLSRDLGAAGYPLMFCPHAVVDHDHERVALVPSLGEHWRRGREFQQMNDRTVRPRDLVRHTLLWLPRMIKRSLRTILAGLRGGDLLAALVGAPVIVATEIAWLAGESRALCARLSGGEEFARTPTNG